MEKIFFQTQKDITLIKSVISLYEGYINDINKMESLDDIDQFLSNCKADNGVCQTLEFEFNRQGYEFEWIRHYKLKPIIYSAYWCTPPHYCETKELKILSLQKRIDILKEIISLTYIEQSI